MVYHCPFFGRSGWVEVWTTSSTVSRVKNRRCWFMLDDQRELPVTDVGFLFYIWSFECRGHSIHFFFKGVCFSEFWNDYFYSRMKWSLAVFRFMGCHRSKYELMAWWMDGWVNECIGGWMNDWMDGWIDVCMDGWVNEWTNEWMDEWHRQIFGIFKKSFHNENEDFFVYTELLYLAGSQQFWESYEMTLVMMMMMMMMMTMMMMMMTMMMMMMMLLMMIVSHNDDDNDGIYWQFEFYCFTYFINHIFYIKYSSIPTNTPQYLQILLNTYKYSSIPTNIPQYLPIFLNTYKYSSIPKNIPQYLQILLNTYKYSLIPANIPQYLQILLNTYKYSSTPTNTPQYLQISSIPTKTSQYLQILLNRTSSQHDRVSLRSSDSINFIVPRICRVPCGDKSLHACGARTWNELPWHVKSSETVVSFKTNLKT